MTKQELAKLKDRLPSKYAATLQKKLKKKTSKTYTLGYIRKGLTFNHLQMHIVDAAIELAEETSYEDSRRIQRIKNLR